MAATAAYYSPGTTSDRHEFQRFRFSADYYASAGLRGAPAQSSRVMYGQPCGRDVNIAGSCNSFLSSSSSTTSGAADYRAASYAAAAVVATSPKMTTTYGGLGPTSHGLGLGHAAGLEYSDGDRLSLRYRQQHGFSTPVNPHASPPPPLPLPNQSSLPSGLAGAGFATIYPWMRSVAAGTFIVVKGRV